MWDSLWPYCLGYPTCDSNVNFTFRKTEEGKWRVARRKCFYALSANTGVPTITDMVTNHGLPWKRGAIYAITHEGRIIATPRARPRLQMAHVLRVFYAGSKRPKRLGKPRLRKTRMTRKERQ